MEKIKGVDQEIVLAALISRVKYAVSVLDQAALDYFAVPPSADARAEYDANLDYALALLMSATRDTCSARPALASNPTVIR